MIHIIAYNRYQVNYYYHECTMYIEVYYMYGILESILISLRYFFSGQFFLIHLRSAVIVSRSYMFCFSFHQNVFESSVYLRSIEI